MKMTPKLTAQMNHFNNEVAKEMKTSSVIALTADPGAKDLYVFLIGNSIRGKYYLGNPGTGWGTEIDNPFLIALDQIEKVDPTAIENLTFGIISESDLAPHEIKWMQDFKAKHD